MLVLQFWKNVQWHFCHYGVRGVCNFLGSVSLQQKFEAINGLVLQLSFIWQAKESTSSKHEGRPTPKTWSVERVEQRSEGLYFDSSFYMFFPPPLEPALCKLGEPGGLFASTWGSHPGPWTFLCSISWTFSFICLLATAILDSFFLFNLTFSPQEMGDPIIWELGCWGLSGYFLLNWDDKAHWASPSCWSQASESL